MPSHDFYTSPEWVAVRDLIVYRDRGRCTVAQLLGGECVGVKHVHHIQSVDDRPDLALDPSNLGTVCAGHHPKWEAVRRAVLKQRADTLEDCGHFHPYKSGREACRRRRMRQKGLVTA